VRPVSLPKWPHPLAGNHLAQVWQVGEGVSPALDASSMWGRDMPIASHDFKVSSSAHIQSGNSTGAVLGQFVGVIDATIVLG
jgi:hypothetical protein